MFTRVALVASLALPSTVLAHISIWHPSMYGFNVTMQTFPYDNRPVAPLMHRTFDDWWFHGHLGYPPHDGDVFEWPAGGSATVQNACNKGYTSWWASSEGSTNIAVPDDRACGDGSPQNVHAASITDVMGCGIGIVDKANVTDIKPEDFAIFTVKHQCPWFTHNQFDVPAEMPACTDGVCHCAWFWIHAPDAGGEQMYMNGFKCKVTNTTSAAKTIMAPQVARRCGADPANNKPADPSNCTVGAQQPLYWFQNDGNNMFEGTYSPPFYNDLYNFNDGAQNYIFTTQAGPYEDASGNLVLPSGSSSSNSTVVTTSVAPAGVTTSAPATVATNVSSGSPATTAKAGFCKRTAGGNSRSRRSVHKKREGIMATLFS